MPRKEKVMDKVILAYKDDLNSTLCVLWLKYKENLAVHTLLMHFGGDVDKQALCELVIDLGATRADVLDVRDKFARNYILPVLRANADVYHGACLGPALMRPLIAEEMARTAAEENTRYVAHGAPQSENEHLRYDAALATLMPDLECFTPFELFTPQFIETQKEKIDKARQRLDLPPFHTHYSCESFWTRCQQSPEIDQLNEPIPEEFYKVTKNPAKAPDKEKIFEISFEEGIPSALDGKRLDPLELITQTAKLGAEHGVGRFEMIDPGLLGLKTRFVVEAPAPTILFAAHRALENVTLDERTLALQQELSQHYRELIYRGHWFTPAREAIDAFFQHTQKTVHGEVRVKLYKGNVSIISREAPKSLYHASRLALNDKTLREYSAIHDYVQIRHLSRRFGAKTKAEDQNK